MYLDYADNSVLEDYVALCGYPKQTRRKSPNTYVHTSSVYQLRKYTSWRETGRLAACIRPKTKKGRVTRRGTGFSTVHTFRAHCGFRGRFPLVHGSGVFSKVHPSGTAVLSERLLPSMRYVRCPPSRHFGPPTQTFARSASGVCQGTYKTTDLPCNARAKPGCKFCGTHQPKGALKEIQLVGRSERPFLACLRAFYPNCSCTSPVCVEVIRSAFDVEWTVLSHARLFPITLTLVTRETRAVSQDAGLSDVPADA